jgi:ubiquitin-like 1-activating enzyme E1 B
LSKKSTDEIVTRVSTRQWAKETNYEPAKLFNKLFNDDIKYLLSMSNLWEKRKPPTPLDWSESLNDHTVPGVVGAQKQNGESSINGAAATNGIKPVEIASYKIWSLSECCSVFSQSVRDLYKRLSDSASENEDTPSILCWDKDDEDAMSFVASAANLRCYIFSIAIKSKFEIKCNKIYFKNDFS